MTPIKAVPGGQAPTLEVSNTANMTLGCHGNMEVEEGLRVADQFRPYGIVAKDNPVASGVQTVMFWTK
jgi:hypothetical protein